MTILQILVHHLFWYAPPPTDLSTQTMTRDWRAKSLQRQILPSSIAGLFFLWSVTVSLLLTHPRLSLCVSSSWALLDFIFSLGILPLRFRFFFSFKHLPSAFCFLPNKQPESSEPEGCSSPTSLNTAKRKRQKEERTHFRKAMPRSEKGMSLLCGEERTHRLQPVWVGMGWGASLLHPCIHPRVNTVSFPPAWHHYPETLKSKILLPCYLCHPKPFANWKSGLWHTQSKFTQSKFNN